MWRMGLPRSLLEFTTRTNKMTSILSIACQAVGFTDSCINRKKVTAYFFSIYNFRLLVNAKVWRHNNEYTNWSMLKNFQLYPASIDKIVFLKLHKNWQIGFSSEVVLTLSQTKLESAINFWFVEILHRWKKCLSLFMGHLQASATKCKHNHLETWLKP